MNKCGRGSFGDVYIGRDITNRAAELVAIKIEDFSKRNPHLMQEGRILSSLAGGAGIPKIYHYGPCGGTICALVMELLGENLEALFQRCNRHFSLHTTLLLADSILRRLEFVHSRYIIHRDIKPQNFIMGRGSKSRILYVIDFGLSHRYRDAITLDHIPYREDRHLTGTARYASIGTHVGCEQSRRDDLESVGYMLVYLLKGQLPWQRLKAGTRKEKYQMVRETKIATGVDKLTAGLPKQFAAYLRYCKALYFRERPDYHYCRSLFKRLYLREQLFTLGKAFDWERITEK